MQVGFAMIALDGVFGSYFAHAKRCVRKHPQTVDIARSVNSLHARLHIFIHFYFPAIHFKLHFAYSFRVGHSADGKQRLVGKYGIVSVDFYFEPVVLVHDFGNSGGSDDFHTFFAKCLRE
jgi:hypothetical protein